ncbi:GcrA family cell cycle regulator [Ferrovibrio terrae]|uniref:GcrA family cell cycle regulator n=1 Tax=Ferrovibrio terrae TaxID=2594003 RepID=UPI003137EDDB
MKSPWTDEKIKALTQHWNAGTSISVIGTAMGMSRNAVVGKAHRLGLPRRADPIHRGPRYSTQPVTAQA